MDVKTYPVLEAARNRTLLDNATYLEWYREERCDPEEVWGEHGKRIEWSSPIPRSRIPPSRAMSRSSGSKTD
ncbi:hypothetical protein F2981_05775 [Sinorhizobium meliloti]|nr:hypothetical protein [Sinorhizobium meliloti]